MLLKAREVEKKLQEVGSKLEFANSGVLVLNKQKDLKMGRIVGL